MRILHVIPTLDPVHGGPPRVAIRVAAGQAQLGHDVTIAHLAPPADRVADIEAAIRDVPGRAQLRVLELPSAAASSLTGRLSADAAALLPDVDVIHLHGIWEPIFRAIAWWARRRRIPYVVLSHGMLTRYSLSQKRWKKRVAMALGYRTMIDRAAFIQALNRDEADEIAYWRPRAPVEIVANGIFAEEIEPLPAAGSAASIWPQLSGRRFVLFIGRLHFVKGLDVLLEAFPTVAAAYPDVDLMLAGPDGGEQAKLEEQARAAGLKDRVHFVGPVYDERKLSLLVDADCFCSPSRHEAFSVAITEALACGKPCVISDTAHFPEVEQARAGRIVPVEAKALANALLDILSDSADRRAMGERAARLVRERFMWPAIATQLVELYGRYGANPARA